MLYWALMFLVVALIAGVLGFTGVAVAAAGIAKVLFVVFLVPVSGFDCRASRQRPPVAELTRIKPQGLQD